MLIAKEHDMEVRVNGTMVPWFEYQTNLIEVSSNEKHPESGPIYILIDGAELILVRGTKADVAIGTPEQMPLTIEGRIHLADYRGVGQGFGFGDASRRGTDIARGDSED